jgi:hypothetical protein
MRGRRHPSLNPKPHARIDSCIAEETFGDRPHHGSLVRQTLNLWPDLPGLFAAGVREKVNERTSENSCLPDSFSAASFNRHHQATRIAAFRFDLPLHAMCYRLREFRATQSVPTVGVEEGPPGLMRGVDSNEVNVLIPYLGPELIAAMLKSENTVALDLRPDSKSATKDSLVALRSQSAVNDKPGNDKPGNDKPGHVPLWRKASRLGCSRLFAAARGLVAPWLR